MRVDRVIGLGAVLLGIPVAAASWGFGVGSPKSPGAGFWPLLIAVVMIGLGLSLGLRPASGTAAASESRWGRFGIALVTLAFYVVSLEPLGYLMAIAVLLFVQLRWVESCSWRTSTWTALLTAVISFILFRVLLKVPLPAGVVPLPSGW